MLPLPSRPAVDVCCSGGDARELSGQSLRLQGPEQPRAWRQTAALTPTPALPGTGLPAAACPLPAQPVPSAWQEAAAGPEPQEKL